MSVEEKPATNGWRRPKAEAEVMAAAVDKAMDGAEAAETGDDVAHQNKKKKTEVPTRGDGYLGRIFGTSRGTETAGSDA